MYNTFHSDGFSHDIDTIIMDLSIAYLKVENSQF